MAGKMELFSLCKTLIDDTIPAGTLPSIVKSDVLLFVLLTEYSNAHYPKKLVTWYYRWK